MSQTPAQEFQSVFGTIMPSLGLDLQDFTATSAQKDGEPRHKWAKPPESKKSKGCGQQGRPQGQRRERGNQNWGPDAASSRGVTQVLQTVQRILTRHEDVIAQVRADSSFVLFLEKGSHSLLNPLLQVSQRWKSLKALLQELLSWHNKFVASEAAIADARKAGLVAAAGNSWAYLHWDHRASQQIPSPAKAPMSFEQAHATMQKILSYIPREHLIHKFHSTRPLTSNSSGENLVFLLAVSTQGSDAAELHSLFRELCYSACLKLVGLRLRPERMDRQPAVQQLQQQLGPLRGSEL
ncbi:unnamed protein product [Effrenium voratum]|nr:unnamed protein product [Effrenium voratum]